MLVVNEPDVVRRTRLQRVLLEYLPHALVAGSSGGAVSGRKALAGALRVTAYEADKVTLSGFVLPPVLGFPGWTPAQIFLLAVYIWS